MKLGIIPINIGVQQGADMIGLAQAAESMGYESVWTFEHVIVPVDYESKYPYNDSGKMGAPPETNFVDPLIALTAIAASTKTIRLGTGVNILSQVNPIYMAKQAASLDFMSNGRFMLGVGIGWLREEFEALGVPFEKRGARFDDYVEGMRKIWSGDVVEHQSDFINWSNFKSYPLPVQTPFPVVMGGIKGKIFERIAKYGNGWYAPEGDPEKLKVHLEKLKAACDAEGRDMSEIEITCMWPGMGGADFLGQLEEAGVHRAVLPMMGGGDLMDKLQGIAETCIAA
ncbi:MAG: LLM class F420-dependent oxidoreductase [Pseudomonadales bacterium]|nr:LLM class F420-dependent oxidoreductase [Pseudomonadales bacterium]MBO6564704.1 LLM class F420-dependent oxidoreductase [Pseudomonadales bacterium]MBO6594380.1 LLM class F420-dependent oxidoreductase [Pseudomonadales bacterium]MBO6655556.1 LLM class F420-dependent oxidoreductase [Pseudomonadales bacterium]MBO6700881.1 LLM class F420-dependent oxidoreductase [Pseudomonadales bacterium]